MGFTALDGSGLCKQIMRIKCWKHSTLRFYVSRAIIVAAFLPTCLYLLTALDLRMFC
jgi:hypothetical protein